MAATPIGAALFLAFGEARSFGFIGYDDGDYVFRNPHLSAGGAFERVRWAFTAFHAANWHPLTWLSFIADEALFGLDPARCTLENIVIHGVNALLLLALLVGSPGASGAARSSRRSSRCTPCGSSQSSGSPSARGC